MYGNGTMHAKIINMFFLLRLLGVILIIAATTNSSVMSNLASLTFIEDTKNAVTAAVLVDPETSRLSRDPVKQLNISQDANLHTPQIAVRHNYTGESYIVKTSDGYLLTIHRVAALNYTDTGKSPVLLLHGMISDSSVYVLNDNSSLAFYMANLGYEVWLGNLRGNTYSREHVSLSTDDEKFWDFRQDEMAENDIPTMVNYIKQKTGKKVICICWSLGCTVELQYASRFPEKAFDSIHAIFSLAPIAYMKNVRSLPIRLLSPVSDKIGVLLKYLTHGEFLSNQKFIGILLDYACESHPDWPPSICDNLLFALVGWNRDQIPDEMVQRMVNHLPSGTSAFTVAQYGQGMVANGSFQLYDYGKVENIRKYGSLIPPEVNVSRIKIPVYCYYGANDELAVEEDVLYLYSKLPIRGGIYRVNDEKFTHFDFIFGKDTITLIYEKLLSDIHNIGL